MLLGLSVRWDGGGMRSTHAIKTSPIVTRDADFAELSTMRGYPAESDLDQARELHNERILRRCFAGTKEGIESLAIDPDTGVLMLF